MRVIVQACAAVLICICFGAAAAQAPQQPVPSATTVECQVPAARQPRHQNQHLSQRVTWLYVGASANHPAGRATRPSNRRVGSKPPTP